MLQGQAALLRSPLLAPALATSGHFCWAPALCSQTCKRRSAHQKTSRTMASRSAAGTAPSTDAAGAPEPPGAVSTSALWQAITDRYNTAQRDAAATMTETNTGEGETGRLGALSDWCCNAPQLNAPQLNAPQVNAMRWFPRRTVTTLLPSSRLQRWCRMKACTLCCGSQPSCETSPSRRQRVSNEPALAPLLAATAGFRQPTLLEGGMQHAPSAELRHACPARSSEAKARAGYAYLCCACTLYNCVPPNHPTSTTPPHPAPHLPAAGQPKKEWRNPFLPYEEALWVADLGGVCQGPAGMQVWPGEHAVLLAGRPGWAAEVVRHAVHQRLGTAAGGAQAPGGGPLHIWQATTASLLPGPGVQRPALPCPTPTPRHLNPPTLPAHTLSSYSPNPTRTPHPTPHIAYPPHPTPPRPAASHVLLLNKFNIVPWHCLVVTSQFRSQLEDLDAADWAATWAVLQASRGLATAK